MKWEKLGKVWAPSGECDWARSHATLPVAHTASDAWWVYVGCRDSTGKNRIARLVVDASPLPRGLPVVRTVAPDPVLSLGEPGTFDDSGVMPSWLVEDGGLLRLYYVGWNVVGTVPYRLSMGLAISSDGGVTFRRYSKGPIVDRSMDEPFFATSPCVLKEGNLWRMWYVSCTGWEEVEGRWEPAYHVKYAQSHDGFSWQLTGESCIDPGPGYSVARPCVFRRGDVYCMIYPFRSMTGYRTNRDNAYRFGYAESGDGVCWKRLDGNIGVIRSETGWDSEMIAYCSLRQYAGETYLLYNGNGFGRSGFGIARLQAWD